ncbi:MAG TPA: TlpA disulfide reductase family protein [Syntrophorhabdaceae bacterium]|jgi:thiol-disulfide isomerase/thioredoxin
MIQNKVFLSLSSHRLRAAILPMISLIIITFICTIFPAAPASSARVAPKGLPPFTLPAPATEQERNYLGLKSPGPFEVGQIRPGVVIIEFFDLECPYCRSATSDVDEVFRKIEGRPDLKGRVTLIGIGMSNDENKVKTYKERYRVPFPVFPDSDMVISRLLNVKTTPTYIAVNVDGKGSAQVFYLQEGVFSSPAAFLGDVISASGLPGARP